MDYYGFPAELYQLKFKSRGDSSLAARVVELYKEVFGSICQVLTLFIQSRSGFLQAGQNARTTLNTESRGMDGRGFAGSGLDHGVFIPFRIMFGDEFVDIPIVEVSIDESMSPEKNWALGKAVTKLRWVNSTIVSHIRIQVRVRQEGILILSGGLTVHNMQDQASWSEATANILQKDFHQALLNAVSEDVRFLSHLVAFLIIDS